MVSITSRKGIKAFFRGEDEVVVQYAGMEASIKVGANMEIKCTGKLTIEAGSIEMKATSSMDLKAGSGLKAEGGANAELKGGALTTIKGALVKIN